MAPDGAASIPAALTASKTNQFNKKSNSQCFDASWSIYSGISLPFCRLNLRTHLDFGDVYFVGISFVRLISFIDSFRFFSTWISLVRNKDFRSCLNPKSNYS